MSQEATPDDDRILQRLLELRLADTDDLPAPRPSASECLERLVAQGRVTSEQIATIRADSQGVPAPPPESFTRPVLGSLGPYRLIEELGRGGMGVVFKAEDTRLRRIVAVKTLVAGEHASPELIARFVREAQAAAKLGSHPHIVPVLDVGQETTRHYIVMEYIEGHSLETLIDEGAIPVRHAARYAAKVARAVQHAHDNGVYHRDLKPANVMVGGDNEPRLTDFGLARLTGDHERLTQSGALVGTPHYMSPEQVQGDYDAIDCRTDVYGMGAILYEMLTDAPPFGGGSTPEIIRKVVLEPPRAPRRANPGVPRDLETICLKALEKPKDRRYDTAAALADDLEHWLNGEPIAASPISGVSRMVRWAKRKPFAAATALLAAVAVVLLALIVRTRWSAAAAWDAQVVDAETDMRYEHFEQALGKFAALVKERPADDRLAQRYREARSGLAKHKALHAAALQEAVRAGQRRDYMAGARARLTRLREVLGQLRALRVDLLTAQDEMWRLNEGGEPEGDDLATAYDAAHSARNAAASEFFARRSRELESHFGAFESSALSAMALEADGAAELLYAGLMERVRLAREYGNFGVSAQFQERLAVLLPGRDDLRPPRMGSVQVAADPADAEVWIAPVETNDGVRTPGTFRRLRGDPGAAVAIGAGGYRIELRKAGYHTARVPVWVRDGACAGDATPIRLLRAGEVGEGFVYVPRGRTCFGAASGSQDRWYFVQREVEGFLIGRFEVTLAEYGKFLIDQRRRGRPVEELMPMFTYPQDYRPLAFVRHGTETRLESAAGLEHSPAMGVSRHQATLYAAWRSARDGRTYRLPTEREWVRAARGADVRSYPWGVGFASTRCIFREAFEGGVEPPSRPGMAPADVSPFGVRDMAGSVQEWVSTLYSARNAAVQVRGGGWSSPLGDCLVNKRHWVHGETLTLDFGFRLAADLPPK